MQGSCAELLNHSSLRRHTGAALGPSLQGHEVSPGGSGGPQERLLSAARQLEKSHLLKAALGLVRPDRAYRMLRLRERGSQVRTGCC